MVSGPGLGDLLGDEDSAHAWASGHANRAKRNQQKSIKEDAARSRAAAKDLRKYNDSAEIKNMKVGHDIADFEEGESAILTFADEEILNSDGTQNERMGLLENVQKMDKFRDVSILGHCFCMIHRKCEGPLTRLVVTAQFYFKCARYEYWTNRACYDFFRIFHTETATRSKKPCKGLRS